MKLKESPEVFFDAIQVKEGGLPPKGMFGNDAKASVEAKVIYLGTGKWKIKTKNLVEVRVEGNNMFLRDHKISVELQSCLHVDRAWETFCHLVQSLYDKHNGTKESSVPKKPQRTNQKTTFGNSGTKMYMSPSRARATSRPRGVFGKASKFFKANNIPEWEFDDEDRPQQHDERELMLEKSPQPDDSFEENRDDEADKLMEDESQDIEYLSDDLKETAVEEKRSNKKQTRRKLSFKRLSRNQAATNDDEDTDDENIFDEQNGKNKMTTPAAQRLVSPVGTAQTTETEGLNTDSDGLSSIVDRINAKKSNPAISSFFQPKAVSSKVSVPERKSFDPRNNAQPSTKSPMTPPRSTQSTALTPTINVLSTTTKTKKRPLKAQDEWLQKSPARVTSSEKHQRQRLFGNYNPSPPRNDLFSKNEDENDPIEESSPSRTTDEPGHPRRTRILKRIKLNPVETSTTPELSDEGRTQNVKTNLASTTFDKISPPPVAEGPVFKGLRNLGNTCYMNASLQMLLTCAGLISSLSNRGGNLIKSVVAVSKMIENTDKDQSLVKSINPKAVKQAMDQKTVKFEGYEQRDAHEFLSELIDYIDEEIKSEPKGAEEAAVQDSRDGEESNIVKNNEGEKSPLDDFCLTVEVCLKCNSCGYSRTKEEMYRHLSIDIIKASDDVSTLSRASVEKGLDHFFQPDIREIKCEKCEEGTHASQTIRILSRPKILLLHLKRFIFVEKEGSRCRVGDENTSPNTPPKAVPVEYMLMKNKAPVEIPASLSMKNFMANLSETKTNSIENTHPEEDQYSLKSIVHHIGSRASSGHYTADAIRELPKAFNIEESTGPTTTDPMTPSNETQRETKTWVTFDDGNTCRTSLDRILKNRFKQETAYMLLYSTEN